MFVYPMFGSSGGGGPTPPPTPVLEGYEWTDGVITGSGGTLSITAPSGITAGDLLVIFTAGSRASGGLSEVDFIPPVGWTSLPQLGNVRVANTFYKIAVGGEGDVSYTNEGAATATQTACYLRISGADATTPISSHSPTPATALSSTYDFDGALSLCPDAYCVSLVYQSDNLPQTLSAAGGDWTKVAQHGYSSHTVALVEGTTQSSGISGKLEMSSTTAKLWTGMLIGVNPDGFTESLYTGPQVEAVQKSESGSYSTTFTLTAPAGITSGELLVLAVGSDDTSADDPAIATPAGWTQALQEGHTNTDCRGAIFYKVSDGTETDVTVTQTNTRKNAGWYIRISGSSGVLDDTDFVEQATWINVYLGATGLTTTVDNTIGIHLGVMDGGTPTHVDTAGDAWLYEDFGVGGATTSGMCAVLAIGKFKTAGENTYINHNWEGTDDHPHVYVEAAFRST